MSSFFRIHFVGWACCLLLLVPWAGAALGQTLTGSVGGTVRDAQGGRLSGATITLVGTRGAVDVITNDQGLYRLAAIDPDTYDLSAAYDGFHPRREVGVVISVGQQLTIDFTLTPALAENVEVIGSPAVVDVKSSSS